MQTDSELEYGNLIIERDSARAKLDNLKVYFQDQYKIAKKKFENENDRESENYLSGLMDAYDEILNML